MKVIDCGKTIALMEKVKQLLPGDDGTLPKKFFTKGGMDTVIQGLRENSVDIDILVSTRAWRTSGSSTACRAGSSS